MPNITDNELMAHDGFPFANEKIPVCNGLPEFIAFIEKYPDYALCPYLADKDDEAWGKSTSRVYMNQVLPNFLYIPVNIAKADADGLFNFFTTVTGMERVAAVNITQPHKSNPVVRKMFLGDEFSADNIDTLIRDNDGTLQSYDLNAPAFVGWFNDTVGSFESMKVVLVGVGGVGEPMAKAIAEQKPDQLILIDPQDKSVLANKLSSQTTITYFQSISDLNLTDLAEKFILINAAGKEGVRDDSGIDTLLTESKDCDNVFVDIRPYLDIDIVNKAQAIGWKAYTGNGMNARNDYSLLQGIAQRLHTVAMSFDDFQLLVDKAS